MTDTDREALRERAQSKAQEIALKHMPLSGQDTYSRDDAEDKLGKSWSDISTIYPHDSATLGQIHDALDDLLEFGYRASLHDDAGRLCLDVMLTQEVMTRLQVEQEEERSDTEGRERRIQQIREGLGFDEGEEDRPSRRLCYDELTTLVREVVQSDEDQEERVYRVYSGFGGDSVTVEATSPEQAQREARSKIPRPERVELVDEEP